MHIRRIYGYMIYVSDQRSLKPPLEMRHLTRKLMDFGAGNLETHQHENPKDSIKGNPTKIALSLVVKLK